MKSKQPDNLLKNNQQLLNTNKLKGNSGMSLNQKESGESLPQIGKNKFSSWQQQKDKQSHLNEFDELILEHDLLLGSGNKKQSGALINKDDDDHFDLDDVIDEIGVSDLLKDSDKKNSNKQS